MSLRGFVRVPAAGVFLALTFIVLHSGVARADAIDGDWCHGDGQRLSINGPDITTPGGARLKGDYDPPPFLLRRPAARTRRRGHRPDGPAERDPDAPEAAVGRKEQNLAPLRQADQLMARRISEPPPPWTRCPG